MRHRVYREVGGPSLEEERPRATMARDGGGGPMGMASIQSFMTLMCMGSVLAANHASAASRSYAGVGVGRGEPQGAAGPWRSHAIDGEVSSEAGGSGVGAIPWRMRDSMAAFWCPWRARAPPAGGD
ncbi:hypothetical protein BRADI_2g24116v3 [Brachypodium distachyon]|uniref:Uncharacterized protein n=1 Tax=Brachypodium distachyon TaxID=15368 RepID=A0A0Q3G451_BRADI|nr:hypothetical protein BRADI_2g24116v3 [Brachypodium distachyon]